MFGRRKGGADGAVTVIDDEVTQTAPSLPAALPTVAVPIYAQALAEPQKRRVWPIVLVVAALTLLLVTAGVAAFLVYHSQQAKIAHLRHVRTHLANQLGAQTQATHNAKAALTTTRTKLQKVNATLLTAQKNLVTARGQAAANYNSGYSAGQSNGYVQGSYDSYQTAYDDGYNTGYNYGYNDGSTAGYNNGYADGSIASYP
jgi:hypothetical protein